MKVNIEIDDDSKFLEALAQEMTQQPQIQSVGAEKDSAEEEGVDIRKNGSVQGFSCVAVSCIGN